MNRNVLSLFSGIGGLELGLENAGFTVIGQVEINEFCRQILAQHWPEVPRHDDVHTAVEWWRSEPRPEVGIVCGGFPCQPASVAGLRLGPADPRWLWPGYQHVIDVFRPPFVLIENVPNLRVLGLLDVIQGLAALGYDAWWSRLPAAAVGAPHLRWRLFIIAVRQGIPFIAAGWRTQHVLQWDRGFSWDVADPECLGLEGSWQPAIGGQGAAGLRRRPAEPGLAGAGAVADTGSEAGGGAGPAGQALQGPEALERPGRRGGLGHGPAGDGRPDPAESGLGGGPDGLSARLDGAAWLARWESGEWERGIPWTILGVSDRKARITALGNAVVPAVAERIGRLILAGAEHGTSQQAH